MKSILYAVAALGTACLCVSVSAAAPKPDFTNLPAYIRALNRSTDPQAAAIRKEIADGPADLAKERAAAKAEGIPLEATQLNRTLPPPSENAAPLYAQWAILEHAKGISLPEFADPLRADYAYTPGQLAQVRAILAAHPAVLHLLHEAAEKPYCVFPEHWTDSDVQVLTEAADRFPALATFGAARMFVTEGYLLAKQGHYRQAIDTDALGFRVEKQVDSAPGLISRLVGDAADIITLVGLEDVLRLAGPNSSVDLYAAHVIREDRPKTDMAPAIRDEVATTLISLDAIRVDVCTGVAVLSGAESDPASPPVESAQDRTFATNILDAAEAYYLARMRSLVSAADLSPMARRKVFAKTTVLSVNDPAQQLVRIMLVEWSKSEIKESEQVARQNIVMAAADVLSVRAKTGAFPAALPGNFKDPFTDKTLGYRREGTDGFVVYSVGAARKFNGGKPGQYKFTPYQVFFRYPGPKPQPVPADMLK